MALAPSQPYTAPHSSSAMARPAVSVRAKPRSTSPSLGARSTAAGGVAPRRSSGGVATATEVSTIAVAYALLIGNAATPLIERITQPTPFGKGASIQARRQASYTLHPDYISREEAAAKTPKKRFLKNKPKKK